MMLAVTKRCVAFALISCLSLEGEGFAQNSPNAALRSTMEHGPENVDPTTNVLQLVEAAVKRLDDLRTAEAIRSNELRIMENKRLDDLRAAESRRIDEQLVLRSGYESQLQEAETARINAIRAVDVGAVAVASERATQSATVLANQVSTSAEALRALVATTAATMAATTQNLTTQLNDRLTALERGSYQNTGRASISDPQIADLVSEMRSMSRAQSVGAGKDEGVNAAYVAVAGLVGIGVAFYAARRPPGRNNGKPTA